MPCKGLMERLRNGETVVCAEGYLFNFEKRGYLQAGAFVPEVVLEHPELVRLQYEEFVHAGSDVVQAFTYYANREKMSVIDREKDVEKLNRDALRMARAVADKTGTLMCGSISNTTTYIQNDPVNNEKVKYIFKYYANREKMSVIDREKDVEKLNRDALRMARAVADKTGTLMCGSISNTTTYIQNDPVNNEKVKYIFKEQVEWAVEGGADYIVAETFSNYGEAKLALDVCKQYAKDLPVVLTFAWHLRKIDGKPVTIDGVALTDVFPRLEAAGADVLGLNCARGPETMLPLMEEIKKVVKVPLAALPVLYRTSEAEPNFQSLRDTKTGKRLVPNNLQCAQLSCEEVVNIGLRCKELGIQYVGLCCSNSAHYTRVLCEVLGNKLFPDNLDCAQLSREEVFNFGLRCKELGIQYIGLCCGNSAHYTRVLCEALGRKPPASRYSTNLDKHYTLGKNEKLHDFNTKYASQFVHGK